jgi:hypothetical protein
MIDNTAAVAVFNDTIESLKDDVIRIKARIKSLKSGKAKTVKTVGVIQRIINNAGYVFLSSYGDQIEIHINMYRLDSFKQAELTNLLQYLLTYTEANGGKVRNTEWPASLNRDYHFTTDNVRFVVAAYVKDGSETCRKVVIGTELVEQHKYQIVCD